MKRGIRIIATGLLLLAFGCKNATPLVKEPWIEKPVSEWPDFALTNEISFKDTTYKNLANSFLIDTGYDTLGISCKHIFMVFQYPVGLKSIDLGKDFNYWKLYPKNDTRKDVVIKRLINTDSLEVIGQFNTLKVRDWILFEIDKKIRFYIP